jgi:hypothetical protein
MKNLAYDIESETVRELSLEMLYQQTAQPDLLSYLPPEAIGGFVSPNGTQILYFILTTPTPTPLPDGMGEAGIYESRAALWLHKQNGETQRLGEVEFCGYSDPFWIDEHTLIIPNGDYMSTCGPTHAWLVDLQSSELHALFPRDIYQSPAWFICEEMHVNS